MPRHEYTDHVTDLRYSRNEQGQQSVAVTFGEPCTVPVMLHDDAGNMTISEERVTLLRIGPDEWDTFKSLCPEFLGAMTGYIERMMSDPEGRRKYLQAIIDQEAARIQAEADQQEADTKAEEMRQRIAEEEAEKERKKAEAEQAKQAAAAAAEKKKLMDEIDQAARENDFEKMAKILKAQLA
tara:strand:+ start:15787 stop:16332 length:546 start_codon:yes stop_codon:yes gene_type:complete